jgi:hypothetical protein
MKKVTKRRLVCGAFLAGLAALPASGSAADPVIHGDGIGNFTEYNPATHTVTLGETVVKLSPEASASMLEQVRQWRPALDQGQPFRVKFAADNGVIYTILLEPRIEGRARPLRGPASGAGPASGTGPGEAGGRQEAPGVKDLPRVEVERPR